MQPQSSAMDEERNAATWHQGMQQPTTPQKWFLNASNICYWAGRCMVCCFFSCKICRFGVSPDLSRAWKVHHIMQMRFTRMPWRSVLHRSLPEDCFHEESCWSCHKCEKLQCIAGIAIRASQRRLLQNRCNGNPSIVMLAAGNQPGIQIEIQSRQPAAAPNYFSIVLVCCRSLS